MTTKDEHNTEVLRKLDEHGKIIDFATSHLGCDERRADAFVKTCGEFFEWDGVRLLFKGAHGKTVAVEDRNCKGFFEREYDFLIPAKSGDGESPDAKLIAEAATSVTAQGKLFLKLHGDKPNTPAAHAETRAKMIALLATARAKGADSTTQKDDAPPERSDGKKLNPWAHDSRNLDSRGMYSAECLTRQAAVAKSDVALASRLAAAHGVTLGATRPRGKAA